MVLAASNGATTERYRKVLELRGRAFPVVLGADGDQGAPAETVPGELLEDSREEEAIADAHSGEQACVVNVSDARRVLPRATRRRLMYNLTVPKILPTARLRAELVRHAVDHPSRPRHAMLTLDPCGAVRVWHYVVVSATAGVRYYEDAEETR